MKRITLLFVLLLTTTILWGQDDDLTFNPKIGANFSGIKEQPNGVSTSNKVGYNAGIDLRIGAGLVFLQPGIFFYQYNQQYDVLTTDIGAVQKTQEIKVQSVKVPVLLGIRPLSSSDFALRLNAGAAFNFPVNVQSDDNTFAISKKNYNSANVGAVFGAGIDLSIITFDINYELGLSDYIDFSKSSNLNSGSSKQYVLSLNMGVRF